MDEPFLTIARMLDEHDKREAAAKVRRLAGMAAPGMSTFDYHVSLAEAVAIATVAMLTPAAED